MKNAGLMVVLLVSLVFGVMASIQAQAEPRQLASATSSPGNSPGPYNPHEPGTTKEAVR
jgi:hypothetical protein